jgi:antitoxin (DNA-binding transcriptional repressor) of toxin-antitoxin stability system
LEIAGRWSRAASLDQPFWPNHILSVAIHVNIGEAMTRLSELLAAAVRGEVVVDKAGVLYATLVPRAEVVQVEHEARAVKREVAIRFAYEKCKQLSLEAFDVAPLMTDGELEEDTNVRRYPVSFI